MGRLCLLGYLRQRPLRLWGCIYRYIWSSKRKSNHGTNFLVFIRKGSIEFANLYNPCLLDRYSVDTGWDTGHPKSHVFSMSYFRLAGESSHRSLRDKVWYPSHSFMFRILRLLHNSIPRPLLQSQPCFIIQPLTIRGNADRNAPVLSAVNGAGLTIAVGCAISALCIGLVAAFGIAILHTFERFVRHK